MVRVEPRWYCDNENKNVIFFLLDVENSPECIVCVSLTTFILRYSLYSLTKTNTIQENS